MKQQWERLEELDAAIRAAYPNEVPNWGLARLVDPVVYSLEVMTGNGDVLVAEGDSVAQLVDDILGELRK
jgi:hypothetical protein